MGRGSQGSCVLGVRIGIIFLSLSWYGAEAERLRVSFERSKPG